MKNLLVTILFVLITTFSFGQKKAGCTGYQDHRNIIKTNITSLAFRNYEIQYERVLSKKLSINLNYGFIPEGTIPMLDTFEPFIDDPDAMDVLNKVQMKQMNAIAELRFYLGKGYGKGFYLAPFYDYSKYTINGFDIEYEDDTMTTQSLTTDGSINGNTFGLLIGTQFNLGKSFVLDWWIIGPHYGFGKGDIVGDSSRPLSETEQQAIRDEINNLDIPMVRYESTVTSEGVELKLDGPWAGIRAGLSLGFRF